MTTRVLTANITAGEASSQVLDIAYATDVAVPASVFDTSTAIVAVSHNVGAITATSVA